MEIERLVFSTLVLLNRWSYSDDASYIASIGASDYLRLSRLIFRIGVMSTPQLKELSITPQRFPSFQSGWCDVSAYALGVVIFMSTRMEATSGVRID